MKSPKQIFHRDDKLLEAFDVDTLYVKVGVAFEKKVLVLCGVRKRMSTDCHGLVDFL